MSSVNFRPPIVTLLQPLKTVAASEDVTFVYSSQYVGGPDASVWSQSDELASLPSNASAMAAPMRSAAASVSRSLTWA